MEDFSYKILKQIEESGETSPGFIGCPILNIVWLTAQALYNFLYWFLAYELQRIAVYINYVVRFVCNRDTDLAYIKSLKGYTVLDLGLVEL